MSSFIQKTFKSVVDPVLKKAGLKQPAIPAGDNAMGMILRFLVINVASVIGAKLLDTAAQYISAKMLQNKEPGQPLETAVNTPALDTKPCPYCGAFRVKGEKCDCKA